MTSFGFLTVRDINLASALAAFGVPFYKPNPITRMNEYGREIVRFNFESTDQGSEIIKQWADKDFVANNPEHPLAYVFAYMHNRERLLDLVKKSLVVHVEHKGGKIFFVPIKKSPTPAGVP